LLPSPIDLVTSAQWIVFAPALVAAFIILWPGWPNLHTSRVGKTVASTLSIGAVLYGFCHSLLLLHAFLTDPQTVQHLAPVEWTFFQSGQTGQLGAVQFGLGVLVDNLSVMMLLVVTSVSLVVQIYTHGYMREDPGYSRFYAYLSMFTASMLGLVVSTNLFEMFFFWELVGVCSYFLIGFWFFKESASKACIKAFVVNRIGDCGFLIGLLMLFGATQSLWAGHNILSFVGPGPTLKGVLEQALTQSPKLLSYENPLLSLSPTNLALISVLIFFGPMAKSAQFPLHVWLPDAMEGPTPISALIHAATMVAAGVYLVARAYPIWQVVPHGEVSYGLQFIAFIGTFTAFMAATIAMSQFDIKRALAWSTVSQLGYMFAGLAAGTFTGGMFHLFNHAFFKAMLFLCSGAVIHGMHGEQDMRKMGGLWKHMPGTAICFLIGTLSISGFPGLSGFFSKDDIIGAAWNYNHLMGAVLLFTAFLTAFYMFRMFFMTFTGEYRGGEVHPHNCPPAMVWPLGALAIPSVLSGWLGVPLGSAMDWFAGKSEAPNPFSAFVYYVQPHFEAANPGMMLAGTSCAFVGIVLAWLVYEKKTVSINTVIAGSTNALLSGVYKFSFNKWYFDEAYFWALDRLMWLYKAAWSLIDMFIVDGIVNGSGLVTETCGQLLKYTENGRAQSYALVIFSFVTVLTLVVYFFHP